MIAVIGNKSVEIQVRTELQQAWAELSEKLSDLIDPAVKYGGGEDYVREFLSTSSTTIDLEEQRESQLLQIQAQISALASDQNLTAQVNETIMKLRERANAVEGTLAATRDEATSILRGFIAELPDLVEGE